MLEFRLNAFELFENTPMPTTRDEAWRRTDIRRLKLENIGPSVNGDAAADVTIPEYLGQQLTADEAGGNMLQIDGVVKQFDLGQELVEQGVIFCDMHTAVNEHPELVQTLLHDRRCADHGRKICRAARRFLARRHFPLCAQEREGGGAAA